MYIAAWLLAGLLLGAGFVRYAQARRRGAHRVLAAGLVIAAIVYVGFAMRAPNVLPWLAVELAGIGIFAALGMMGLRSSPWWLAAGWALHPVWDVALHYLGPGAAFTPQWYAIACVSFDLVVAGYAGTLAMNRSKDSSSFLRNGSKRV